MGKRVSIDIFCDNTFAPPGHEEGSEIIAVGNLFGTREAIGVPGNSKQFRKPKWLDLCAICRASAEITHLQMQELYEKHGQYEGAGVAKSDFDEAREESGGYPCFLCAATFTLSSSMIGHLRNLHQAPPDWGLARIAVVTCPFCPKLVADAAGLSKHLARRGGLELEPHYGAVNYAQAFQIAKESPDKKLQAWARGIMRQLTNAGLMDREEA